MISRITTAGTITGFTAPSVARPYRVAAGPDNAMWFTNSGNNSVGRITTDGTITNYADASIADPHGIVTGPDGALWFANFGNSTVGRVTTAGVVTDFNNPAIAHPDSITVGPDNAPGSPIPGTTRSGGSRPDGYPSGLVGSCDWMSLIIELSQTFAGLLSVSLQTVAVNTLAVPIAPLLMSDAESESATATWSWVLSASTPGS